MASKSSKDVLPPEPMIYNDEELRIVMVGKTGAGKSATGNTILGKKAFESRFSAESLTLHCAKKYGEVEREKVSVIDTPGLFYTRITETENLREVAQSVMYAAPGPHVFLVVIKLGRFTEEEKQTVQMIQKVFGADADRYSMVLFTHGDQLRGRSIEDFLKESEELQELVARCNHQYHVFNNELKDRSQVTELLHKIRKIREKNGGHHYTTEMFQAAEREIQEEAQRILMEAEEKMLKELKAERKKLEAKYEEQISEFKDEMEKMKELMKSHEREIKKIKQILKEKQKRQSREKAERSFDLIKKILDILLTLINIGTAFINFKRMF